MRTAIDTNVISALWSKEPTCQLVLTLLGEAHRAGGLVICGVVYAELLAHPKATQQFVDEFLVTTNVIVDYELEAKIWLDAGKRFATHVQRRRAGKHHGPKRLLADFLVGSHARACADRLLTLDGSRYAIDYNDLLIMG